MDGRDEPPANATAWDENDQRKALLMKALLAVTCGKAGAGGCERSQPIALRQRDLSTQDARFARFPNQKSPCGEESSGWTSLRTQQRSYRFTSIPSSLSLGSNGLVSVDAGGLEAAADWTNLRSPETYGGYGRSENFASRDAAALDQRRAYRAPARLALNQWSLAGEWTMGRVPTVLNQASGQIVYRFHARDVHLVMGPSRPGSSVRFRVTIDGQPPNAAHGLDVDEAGNGTAVDQRLYQLIRQPKPIVDRTFAIEFLDPGIEAFAFTFG
jgi:hypothetical protein